MEKSTFKEFGENVVSFIGLYLGRKKKSVVTPMTEEESREAAAQVERQKVISEKMKEAKTSKERRELWNDMMADTEETKDKYPGYPNAQRTIDGIEQMKEDLKNFKGTNEERSQMIKDKINAILQGEED